MSLIKRRTCIYGSSIRDTFLIFILQKQSLSVPIVIDGKNYTVTVRKLNNDMPTTNCLNARIVITIWQSNNSYHSVHYSTFNCQVCHSQNYNNCGSCHVHGEGARIPSYMDFKIAVNPIPDLKPGRFALVRRTLAAPITGKNMVCNNMQTLMPFLHLIILLLTTS